MTLTQFRNAGKVVVEMEDHERLLEEIAAVHERIDLCRRKLSELEPDAAEHFESLDLNIGFEGRRSVPSLSVSETEMEFEELEAAQRHWKLISNVLEELEQSSKDRVGVLKNEFSGI
jgi:chaperonin cofactor prefoldin